MSSHGLAAIALRGADSIVSRRSRTTMGLRFPENDVTGVDGLYGSSLYRGASGVGIALVDLAAATRDRDVLDFADEVRDGFIECIPTEGTLATGLYEGAAGVALFHLARARAFCEAESLERAAVLAHRLATVPFVDTDIISGAAGMGLLQLSLYHATRDDCFLEHARQCAAFLEATAVRIDDGAAWPMRDPRQPLVGNELKDYAGEATHLQTGLAHGTAGVCLFLVELAATHRAPEAIPLAERGLRWVDAQAADTGHGVQWPHSDARPKLRTHWCHGSTGIAHLYVALHRHRVRKDALHRATAAGEAVWTSLRSQRRESSCHCHGLAGAMELFLDLATCGAGIMWCERAGAVAARLSRRAVRHRHRAIDTAHADVATACPFGSEGAGLSVGTAGIVHVLLRGSGQSVFPILPDSAGQWATQCKVTSNRAAPAHHPSPAPLDLPVSDAVLAELVPRAAARLSTGDRLVVLGAPDALAVRGTARLIAARPAGHAYGRALQRLTHAATRLAARHAGVVASGALEPRSFGALLREIAGLALSPRADTDRVVKAADRMTTHAIAAMETMLDQVAEDRSTVLGHTAGGRVADIEVGGGDSHGGGRHVVRLSFESGSTLLYKPRSVAVDRELAGVSTDRPTLADRTNAWLSPSIAGGRLPTHRLIDAGAWHGYAEQIASPQGWPAEAAPALSPDCDVPAPETSVARIAPGDERRFWYSAGLLAGHAFTLGAHDLHVENVMCGHSGSTPELALHAVDLELAFGNVDDLADTLLVQPPEWGDHEPMGARHSHAAFDASPSFTCGVHAEDWAIELTRDGPRPVGRPKDAVRWTFPHIAQNADGTFGYGRELCAFLRGFADQWMVLQCHTSEVADHLRTALSGTAARVLAKRTQGYLTEITRRKHGGPPEPGASFDVRQPAALPLIRAELAQLDELDFPYFFQFLGEHDGARRGTYWKPGPHSPTEVAREFAALPRHTPFWSIVERQASEERLSRAILDAVRFVAPAGEFDMHDPTLGVHVARRTGDARLWIVVLLGERRDERLTVRAAPTGAFEWWRD